jgi:hypothetical protein
VTNHDWKRFPRFFLIAGFVGAFSADVKAIDLYKDTVPQAQLDTCQSYSIVLALAAQGDPAFPIANFAALRRAEADFRRIANETPGGPFGHDALKQAVTKYASGAYRLVVEYPGSDIIQWVSRVRALTTLEASADAVLGKLTGTKFPVALTSVTKLNQSTYGGHIVALLGVFGSGVDSNTQLLTFNSAIKGQGGSVNRCEPGTQPGDMRYQAGVVATNNFTLRQFSAGSASSESYVIMHLEKI